MRTALIVAAIAGLSSAQNQVFNKKAACCPSACGSSAPNKNMCCKPCPRRCTLAPEQNSLTVDSVSCSQTMLSWSAPVSCAPITQMDIQCKDRNGQFKNLPTVYGNRSQWMVENDHFRGVLNRSSNGFGLQSGDNVVCQVRSVNKVGFSPWSKMSVAIPLHECLKPVQSIPDEETDPVKCGFACAIRKRNCSGKYCGDVLTREEILSAADHIISAKNQEYMNWVYDKDYGLNQACCSLPFFSAACHCDQTLSKQTGGAPAITSATCGCAGQANCGCSAQKVEEVADAPKTVKHKHAYKKKPQFKTVINEVKYTEMEKKVEMRPVEETFVKTIMVKKTVDKPRTVMHMMTRTRQVPQIKQRTVMQLKTVCQKVRKEVPVEALVDCPCDTAAKPDCQCGPAVPSYKVEIVDECDQQEVPRSVQYTEMVQEPYEVQVPTVYVEKIDVEVPKEVSEVRTVMKAFEIEIPVEKVKREAVQVPIPVLEDSFYEHAHVGGEEAHSHGAAVDPDTVSDADPCAAHNCPVGKMAFKATDGVCYCTVM